MSQQVWVESRQPYYIRCGCALENPFGVPHEEIAQQLVDENAAYCAQVIFGLLVPDDGAVFNFDTVRWLFDPTADTVAGSEFVDEEAVVQARAAIERFGPQNGRYAAGADLARKKDASVIFVLDVAGVPLVPARVVYYRRLQRVPWPMVYAELARASVLFGTTVLCDSTGIGDVVIDAVEGRTYCPEHHQMFEVGHVCPIRSAEMDCRPSWGTVSVDGYVFTQTSKVQLVTHLSQMLSAGFDEDRPDQPCGWIRSPPIPKLRHGLQTYQFDDKKLETDEVFGLALAAWSGLHDLQGMPVVGSPWEG